MKYYSGKTELIKTIENDDNVHINGNNIRIENGKIVGISYGKSIVTIYRDGSSISYFINVIPKSKVENQILVAFIISLFIILSIFVVVVIYFKMRDRNNE